jgi:hypothetical protein
MHSPHYHFYIMKRTALLYVLMLTCAAAFAQSRLTAPHNLLGKFRPAVQSPIHEQLFTGFENINAGEASVPAAGNRFFSENIIGITQYDLQTNNSVPNRIHNWGDGKVSATFMLSQTGEGSPYSDRGTGINSNASGAFDDPVTTRLEGIRTGFPSYAVAPNGEEWVTTHVAGNKIHFAHRAAGATAWIEGDIPITRTNPGLWTDVAIGGADGKTIHVIYLTTPTGNGGTAVDGMNGTVKYCRSTDNGTTWDIIDASLPGVNSDNYLNFSANCYSISANGNTVAIGIFHLLNDVLLFKSEDNGTTWAAPRIAHNFPLTKWTFDAGYTFDQIQSEFNPDIWPAPNGVVDSLAILTNDGSGTVLVDENGVAHVAFSTFFIRDPDTTNDDSYSLYPGMNLGIVYWNDLQDDNSGIVAAYSPDVDGDGNYGTGAEDIYWQGYGGIGLSTGPSMGMDAAGQVYISYTSNHELNVSADNFFYKQPFIVRSDASWTAFGAPVPMLQEDLVQDFVVTSFTENYYVALADKVDNYAHIVWQQDFTQGVSLRTDGTQPAEDNTINHLEFPANRVSSSVKQPNLLQKAAIAPNPASNFAQLSLHLDKAAELNVQVLNIAGQSCQEQNTQGNSGENVLFLNTSTLEKGVYFVRVTAGAQVETLKLMVAK